MHDKKGVCFITKNIPVKRVEGNPVILNLATSIAKHENISIIFPSEYVPGVIGFFGKRLSKYAELKGDMVLNSGVKIYFLNFLSLPVLRYTFLSFFTKKWIKRNEGFLSGYKVFHAHYVFPDGYIAYKINSLFKVPYVVTIREGDFNRYYKMHKAMQKKSIKILLCASYVTVPSYALKEKCIKEFGITPEVIPHGIDLSKIQKSEKGVEKYQPATASIKLLTVSQLIKRKNVDWVIKYASKYGYQLDVVGDGPEISSLTKLACDDDNIRFLGKLSSEKVYEAMREADVFILPSSNETFGMVYLEAAANKCVIVAKKETGIHKLFDENEAVFVSSQTDMEIKLNELLNSKGRIQKLKIGALSRVNDFDIKNICDKYIDIYNGFSSKCEVDKHG